MATMAWREADPVAALADMLDQIDVSARRTHRRARQDENTRLNILKVHATWAIIVALLFASNGPAATASRSYDYLRWMPGFPYTLAAVLLVGGLILFPATVMRNRPWEMVGVAMLMVWYATMGLGFLIPVAQWSWHAVPALLAGQPLPPGQPGMHAPGVYDHPLNVLLVHLIVLVRRERDARSGL